MEWTRSDVAAGLGVKCTTSRGRRDESRTHPDAQEHVDGVGACHVTDGRVGVLILDGGHFAGKRIWTGREKRERRRVGQRVERTDGDSSLDVK